MAFLDFLTSLIGIFFFGSMAISPDSGVIGASPITKPVSDTTINTTSQTEKTLQNQVKVPSNTIAPSDTAVSSDQTMPTETEKITNLAKCLTQKGVVFYGAYWCPHCQDQKAEFGTAIKYITYQECDDQGEGGNQRLCQSVGIESYPTWVFKNGVKLAGKQSLETLSQKSNCPY